MDRAFGRRPWGAVTVAAAAIIAAGVGSAIAGPGASDSALSKKKVKQIATTVANQEIDKRAPGLSVASAKNADTANTANSANTAETANTANSANTANTANTALNALNALNAQSLDGAEICRTDGVITQDDDEADATICQRGALGLRVRCIAAGTNTSGAIILSTTQAGTFSNSPEQTLESTPGPDGSIGIAEVTDAAGGGATLSPVSPYFTGVPSTGDQISGVAGVRADSTGTDEGSCDFVLTGID